MITPKLKTLRIIRAHPARFMRPSISGWGGWVLPTGYSRHRVFDLSSSYVTPGWPTEANSPLCVLPITTSNAAFQQTSENFNPGRIYSVKLMNCRLPF